MQSYPHGSLKLYIRYKMQLQGKKNLWNEVSDMSLVHNKCVSDTFW